jgi:hypothetical protein
MTGWQCPGCKACYAPHVSECSRCRGAMVPAPYVYPMPWRPQPPWGYPNVIYTTSTSGLSDTTCVVANTTSYSQSALLEVGRRLVRR